MSKENNRRIDQALGQYSSYLVGRYTELNQQYQQGKYLHAWKTAETILMSINPEHSDKQLLELIQRNIQYVQNIRGLHVQDTQTKKLRGMIQLNNKYGNKIRGEVNKILWGYGYFEMIKKALLEATAGTRESGANKYEPIPSQLPSEVKEQ